MCGFDVPCLEICPCLICVVICSIKQCQNYKNCIIIVQKKQLQSLSDWVVLVFFLYFQNFKEDCTIAKFSDESAPLLQVFQKEEVRCSC